MGQVDEDELVECYTDNNCLQDATFVLMTRRECCVMNENRFSFRSSEAGEACSVCVGKYILLQLITLHTSCKSVLNSDVKCIDSSGILIATVILNVQIMS